MDGFTQLERRVGYARALQRIDRLRDDVQALLPEAWGVRSNRTSVEFAFAASCPRAAEATLRQLVARIEQGIGADEQGATAAVRIAAVPSEDDTLSEAALRHAEQLLRQAQEGRIPVLVGEAEAGAADDRALLADLRAAIAADELRLHYQPKLRARTGELAGSEALLRWTHPSRGPVPPDLFIPLAEKSGDIEALTRWVVDRAIADHRLLGADGLAIPTHVNISAPLLARPDFTASLLRQVAGHERLIGFEITETAMLVDPEGSLARLHEIAARGVRLAIDDYGSGFSSLAYLSRMPVHEIKIDRLFISRLATSQRDPLLVRSTIGLAHALEMEVTAEGVESAAALALLQVMGCDIVQGFFIAPALPLDGLRAFARDAISGRTLPRPANLSERRAARRARQEGADPCE